MSVIKEIKEYIKQLHEAGCIVDTLGLAGDVIDAGLADGTFTKCNKCKRVFKTERLLDGICELCINGIERRTIGQLIDEFDKGII